MPVFEVNLVHISPHSDWIRTKITPNMATFHAVNFDFSQCWQDVSDSTLRSRSATSWRCFNIPVDTGRKLNVHKTFSTRPGRLLNVLCTFNLRPLSTGIYQCWIYIESLLTNWCFSLIFAFTLKWYLWFSIFSAFLNCRNCKHFCIMYTFWLHRFNIHKEAL